MTLSNPAQPHLLLLGNINVDIVMGPIGDWPAIGTEVITERGEFRAGGAAGNAALALEAMGKPYLMVTSHGSDSLGSWLAGEFSTSHTRLHRQPGPTTVSVGVTHANGERTFFTTPGHLLHLTLDPLLPLIPHNVTPGSIALICGVFLSPHLLPRLHGLLPFLRSRGYRIALDTGWPDGTGWTQPLCATVKSWLPDIDHLLFNEAELIGLAFGHEPATNPGRTPTVEDAIARLMPLLPSHATLVAKLGPGGATGRRGEERWDLKAPRVTPIDTVGAGDTFNAGYLAALLDGADPRHAIATGITCAAAAISTYPRRYGIED